MDPKINSIRYLTGGGEATVIVHDALAAEAAWKHVL